jgi:hypothetical protein
MKTYFGIIDDMGIESFIDLEGLKREDMLRALKNEKKYKMASTINYLLLRARMNPHRHSQVYCVTLSDGLAKKMNSMIERGLYMEAVRFLGKHDIEIVKIK